MHAKLLQSCLILCDLVDCSLPGSSVHGILQTRILEWVAMPSFRGSSWPRDQTHTFGVSCTGRQVLHHWGTWDAQLGKSRHPLFHAQNCLGGMKEIQNKLNQTCSWDWTYLRLAGNNRDAPTCLADTEIRINVILSHWVLGWYSLQPYYGNRWPEVDTGKWGVISTKCDFDQGYRLQENHYKWPEKVRKL